MSQANREKGRADAAVAARSTVRVEGSPEDNSTLEKQVLADFGETPQGLEEKRRHGAQVAQSLERMNADKDARLRPFRVEFDNCNKRWEELQMQQQLLQKQLAGVQAESSSVAVRMTQLQGLIAENQHKFEQQSAFEQANRGIAAVVNLREGVHSLLHAVKELDGSLAEAVGLGTGEYSRHLRQQRQQNQQLQRERAAIPDKEFPVRIAAASAALASFALTTSRCMALLAQRVVLARATCKHKTEECEVCGWVCSFM